MRMLLLSIALVACSREGSRTAATDSTPAKSTIPPARPAAKPGLIEVHNPFPGDRIQSPLAMEGLAKGPWYFEASFPVYLINAAGDTIARVPAEAQGEWMTETMVPFKATLEFTPPAGDSGTLIFARSNASGLPEHDDELRVPIRFR